MEVLEERGKPEYQGKKQQSTEPTNLAKVTPSLEIKSSPHGWDVCAQ